MGWRRDVRLWRSQGGRTKLADMRATPTEILLATSNPNKVREVREVLEPLGVRVLSLTDLDGAHVAMGALAFVALGQVIRVRRVEQVVVGGGHEHGHRVVEHRPVTRGGHVHQMRLALGEGFGAFGGGGAHQAFDVIGGDPPVPPRLGDQGHGPRRARRVHQPARCLPPAADVTAQPGTRRPGAVVGPQASRIPTGHEPGRDRVEQRPHPHQIGDGLGQRPVVQTFGASQRLKHFDQRRHQLPDGSGGPLTTIPPTPRPPRLTRPRPRSAGTRPGRPRAATTGVAVVAFIWRSGTGEVVHAHHPPQGV